MTVFVWINGMNAQANTAIARISLGAASQVYNQEFLNVTV